MPDISGLSTIVYIVCEAQWEVVFVMALVIVRSCHGFPVSRVLRIPTSDSVCSVRGFVFESPSVNHFNLTYTKTCVG